MESETPYSNIRDIMGDLIGQKLLEITQHDEEYFRRTGRGFVDLMFDGGDVLRIYSIRGDEPLFGINVDADGEAEMFGDSPQ